ncbi:MAG: caspase family protein, partial [Bacteroidia bacterium]|nr:caspase family protein [Bacteroidia bacterium]
MIKQVLLSFALLLLNPIFSQTPGESIDLESIIGFEVAEVTDANLTSLGMKPTTGARGVKLIHMGPKIIKSKTYTSMGPGVEGDILTQIQITNNFGKIFEQRAIFGLKDFCNVLIQYKEKGGNYHIIAIAEKTHNDKTRHYVINITSLNSVFLTQYVQSIDKPAIVAENKKLKSEVFEEKPALNILSILGFEVTHATNEELQIAGQNPTIGEGGVKLVNMGYKLTVAAGSYQDGKSPQGDILTHMILSNKWGKLVDIHPIKDLKDFYTTLIQYKQREGKYTVLVRTFEKVPASPVAMIGMMGGGGPVSTSHKYNINILELNVAQLYEYVSNLDQLKKVEEKPKAETKPKNDISAKNTKRNSEEEEESKDIYASNVDFDKPGKFYAIIIGASNYSDPGIPDLDSLPIKDAMALKKVLSQKYIFDKENIKALYNPTRRDIVIAFAEMSKKITSEDNLLIFYAGHGHYEKESDLGYWLPVDAEVGNPSNWLYND